MPDGEEVGCCLDNILFDLCDSIYGCCFCNRQYDAEGAAAARPAPAMGQGHC